MDGAWPGSLYGVSNRMDAWANYVRTVDGRALAGHQMVSAAPTAYDASEFSNNNIRSPAWTFSPVFAGLVLRLRRNLSSEWSMALGLQGQFAQSQETALDRSYLSNAGGVGYVGMIRSSWLDKGGFFSLLGEVDGTWAPEALNAYGVRPEVSLGLSAGAAWLFSQTRALIEIFEKLQGGTPTVFTDPSASSLVLSRSEAVDWTVQRQAQALLFRLRLSLGASMPVSAEAWVRLRVGASLWAASWSPGTEQTAGTAAEYPPAGVTYLSATGESAAYQLATLAAGSSILTSQMRFSPSPFAEIGWGRRF